MKWAGVAGMLLLLTAGAAAAPTIAFHGDRAAGMAVGGGFSADLKTVQIDENVTLNVSVYNPLPIDDTLQVEFSGPAISSNRIVKPYFPAPPCNTVTTATTEVCELTSVSAESWENLTITLQGTKEGQERLSGAVNSTTTDLGSAADVQIRVGARYGSAGIFSAPGIGFLQFLLLPLLAAVLLLVQYRNP